MIGFVLLVALAAYASAVQVQAQPLAAHVQAKPSKCQLCQAVATAAHAAVLFEGWNATVLEGELNNVCKIVPAKYLGECQLLIGAFGTVECQCLANTSNFNATQCCSDVQLCTGGATQAAKLPLALLTPPKPKAAPLSKLSAECRGCQVVAKMAHYAAEVGGLSGAQLDAYMTDLCKYVPTEFEQECEAVLSVGLSKLTQCVADQKKFNAQKCCSDVSVCPAPSR
eukprot:TRINITY_DN365_c0_g1_i1.p1 TRINITY_DN365_c0_g1~~TRINITY_DN365_c0_g1_i1.p1  ORF type:complete len:261 (+),score=75.77 TRINITY_DN365_c0_g1_i1:110-784(+)